MSKIDGVFSIRIVIADYYMEKPIYGLDPCYSEFRGKEIKKVPIIRVFGPNASGQKCSMHVHGVFPYFYIPYERKDFESVNRAIYQIASNVDKAINISLGQSNSDAQHVFKVQLVKGLPFYGYHRAEHQFLKIYMFNPRFVKRAANLLQNGAIMGKTFHPHESHVPYILQFMIDYNLYGMSFLHVPTEIVKYRRSDEDDEIPCSNLQPEQILDCTIVKKQTISALEIDIGSSFILNRFQLVTKSNSNHTNPGIEAIWNDEQIRRQKLVESLAGNEEKINAIPPLEVPATQPRPDVQVAESEIFYRTGLLSKLATLDASLSTSGSVLDQTISGSQQTPINNLTLNATKPLTEKEKKRTFNINKLLVNAVYPEECTPDQEQLTNASFIDNHLAANNLFQNSLLNLSLSNESAKQTPKAAEDESVFMDDTIIDEDLVLSLTQQQPTVPMNATLREEDMQLLDVLQQLDEQSEEANKVDLDSTLAPLSQTHKNYEISTEKLDKQAAALATNQPLPSSDSESEHENDESKENIHDFSIALEDINDLILKFSQSQSNLTPPKAYNDEKLPQVDGSDDLLPRTPTKQRVAMQTDSLRSPQTPKHNSIANALALSPNRSPRTPKSKAAAKYAALPLVISNKSGKKQPSDQISQERGADVRISLGSLRKKLAMSELRRKSVSAVSDLAAETALEANSRPIARRGRPPKNLDKTHITCSLTPRRTSERLLKVYTTSDMPETNANEVNPGGTESPIQSSTSSSSASKRGRTEAQQSLENDDIKQPKTRIRRSTSRSNRKMRQAVQSDNKLDIEAANGGTQKEKEESKHDRSQGRPIKGNVELKELRIRCRKSVTSCKIEDKKAEKCSLSQDAGSTDKVRDIHHEENTPKMDKKQEKDEKENEVQLSRTRPRRNMNCSKIEVKTSEHSIAGQDVVKTDTPHKYTGCGGNKIQTQESFKMNNETEQPRTRHRRSVSGYNCPKHSDNIVEEIQPGKMGSESLQERQFKDSAVERKQRLKPESTDKSTQVKEKLKVYENIQPMVNNKNTSTNSTRLVKHAAIEKSTRILRVRLRRISQPKLTTTNFGNDDEQNEISKCLVNNNNEIRPKTETEQISYSTKISKSEKTPTQERKAFADVKTENTAVEGTQENGYGGSDVDGKNSPQPQTGSTMDAIKALNEALVKLNQSTNKEHAEPPTEHDDDDEIIASDEEHNQLPLRKTPNLKRLRRSFVAAQRLKRRNRSTTYLNVSRKCVETEAITTPQQQSEEIFKADVSDDSDENPALIESFYEQSFFVNSPSLFSTESSPFLGGKLGSNNTPTTQPKNELQVLALSGSDKGATPTTSGISRLALENKRLNWSPAQVKSNGTNESSDSVLITPLEFPPSRSEVVVGCQKFGLLEYEFQGPFFSNPDDVTKAKEIGFTVLNIPGNKLNDCEPFESILGNQLHGLHAWRCQKLVDMGGPMMLNRFRTAEQMREYFSTNKRVTIEPQQSAPTRHDAKLWLKARALMLNRNEQEAKTRVEDDSPIKIRRQKVTMMMNDDGVAGDAGDSGDDADMDVSSCSLSLTPMSPATPVLQSQVAGKTTEATPLSTLACGELATTSASRKPSLHRRALRRKRAKQSLSSQLNAVAKDESAVLSDVTNSQPISSQTSESSISSQAALAAMERSSFLRNLKMGSSASPLPHDVSFGLTNATLDNTFGFKVKLENLQQAKADIEYNYLTIITLEVFVATRRDLHPDPQWDEIRCLFYAIENSIPIQESLQELPRRCCGYIIVNDSNDIVENEGRRHGIDKDIEVQVVPTEIDAIQALLALCAKWDADIYAGYELEMSSWGYVIDRAKYLCFNIAPLLSRVPTQKQREIKDDDDQEQYTDLDFEIKLCGRILLDVWRLMRSEIALTSYTFENVMYHILHKRCPWHSYRDLTEWFASPCSRWIVLEYYLERVRGTLKLLDQLDLIGRTSEMAKLIGIQFYEILSRGSQFRVESMMLRIAKPKNLVPLSPSVQQRVHMRAPEYIALIMEPESRFYVDPVIVLDFQSLYPSMIIAYNYCFSTCLGRVEHLGSSSPFEFGASQLRIPPKLLRQLLDEDLLTISPCGVVFVKSCVREGILPRMLTEILDTRQMVKQSMKLHKTNSALQRILHSRQLGLKLMANVTYGYTAANFSGRMPSVEVGDSVVSKGREALEQAIKYVESNDRWNVRVVYGDTDSMFVLVPGRDREQAFKIGEEIAAEITKANPHPVKLKLEKVYQPCILQTKKRYVGYMYETADQAEPVFEAKGIETVRRDGCPAVGKMLEKVLRILFETKDVSLVKQYVCRQFTKLLAGRANLQDLIFAKEFRGLNGYKPAACVPALELTRKWIQHDPRRIPRRGERVPFIVTNGPPGVPLIRLVRHPHDVLKNEGLKINAIYYITKAIIPPLNRCLLLIGADVHEWFLNLPRKVLITPALSTAKEMIGIKKSHGKQQHPQKSTISQYFSTSNCIIDCGRQTMHGICEICSADKMKVFVKLHEKIGRLERGYFLTQQMCQVCCGRVGDLKCGSLDCPVLYVLEVKRRDLQQIQHIRSLLETNF